MNGDFQQSSLVAGTILYSSPFTISPRGSECAEPHCVVLAQSATFAPFTTANPRLVLPQTETSFFGGCPVPGGSDSGLAPGAVSGMRESVVPGPRVWCRFFIAIQPTLYYSSVVSTPAMPPSIPGRHRMAVLLSGSGTGSPAEPDFVSRTFTVDRRPGSRSGTRVSTCPPLSSS